MEDGAGGAEGGWVIAQAEAVECCDLEMFPESELGGFRGEGPIFVGVDAGDGALEQFGECGVL